MDDEVVLRTLKRRHGASFLVGLLEHAVSRDVKDARKFGNISVLPLELLALHLGKYGYRDAFNIALSCKLFHRAVQLPTFWRHGVRERFKEIVHGVDPASYVADDFDPFVRHPMRRRIPPLAYLSWIFDDDYWQSTVSPSLGFKLVLFTNYGRDHCDVMFNWRRKTDDPSVLTCNVVFGTFRVRKLGYVVGQAYYAVKSRFLFDNLCCQEVIYEYRKPVSVYHHVCIHNVETGNTFRGRGIGEGRHPFRVFPDETCGKWDV